MAQPSGASTACSVDPKFYAMARSVEDRLIALIDAGEDLADWYPRTRLSGFIREVR